MNPQNSLQSGVLSPNPQPQSNIQPGGALQAPGALPQLDQDAVNLAKAIRQTESGGDFKARGKSGEYGAYQYTKPTWDAYATRHLGRAVPLEAATPEEQNEVTYKQIKEWKDQGYNPGQIASMWNSGKPDAYLDPKYKGKNSYGVEYDVPKYAQTVAQAYQAIKRGEQPQSLVGPSAAIPQAQAGGEQEGPGFVQGMAQTIARPFLKGAANVAGTFEAGKGLIKAILGQDTSSNQARVEQIQKEGIDFGYLGKARPIGSEYDSEGNKRGFGAQVKDAIGTGLEAATYVAPAGAAVKTAQAVRGGKALTVAAKGAFTGAEAGALQGAGSALQEGGSLGDVVKEAGFGAAGGAVTGGVLGGIGGQLGKLTGQGKQNAAIHTNIKGLNELENANAPLRRYVQEQKEAGFDVIKDIGSSDLLRGSVDKEGIMRTTDAIAQYQKALEETEGVVANILKRENGTIDAKTLEKAAFDNIAKKGLEGAAKKRAQQEALADIEVFIEEAGGNNIPLELIHRAKASRYKTLNYSNPESGIAGKAIAKAYKEAVEKGTKSVEIKRINRELQRHFANIKFLEKLDGKRVQGGRLGKYFAQTVGGVAGSHFGPLGTIIGADIAGRIMGRNLAGKFGGKTGGLIPKASDAMKRAIRVGEGTERKLPVKSQPSQFTNELPTIEFGKKATPKGKKKMPGLPTIR